MNRIREAVIISVANGLITTLPKSKSLTRIKRLYDARAKDLAADAKYTLNPQAHIRAFHEELVRVTTAFARCPDLTTAECLALMWALTADMFFLIRKEYAVYGDQERENKKANRNVRTPHTDAFRVWGNIEAAFQSAQNDFGIVITEKDKDCGCVICDRIIGNWFS